MPDVVVAGAGMAGLAAAAHARSLGAAVELHEKGDRPGGAMLLSSGVVWRHRRFEDFRAECPGGDEALQRLVWERLDGDLAWLESLGARVLARDTGNPLTTGWRFDTGSLTDALARAAGAIHLASPVRAAREHAPLVLATGGFAADRELVRRHVTPQADHLVLRSTPWSTGDGLRIGLAAGAALTHGMDEFYGRNLPAPPARIDADRFVGLAQLYARHATVTNERGERYAARTWSEIDVVQWTARQPRARAWYAVPAAALGERVRDRTVADMVAVARAAGAPVREAGDGVVVEVVAGITTTLGGLRVDGRAQAAPGVFAAGNDAGGIALGGYASGLAAALVLGRVAAAAAVGEDA